MVDNFSRGLSSNERRQFRNGGLGDSVDRAEVAQQAGLSFLSHSGNRGQLGSEVAQLAALAMISDSVTMRFVANHLNQAKNRRMRIEIDGFVFAAFDQKVSDLRCVEAEA